MKCRTEGCKGKTTTFQEGSTEHHQWIEKKARQDNRPPWGLLGWGFFIVGLFLTFH